MQISISRKNCHSYPFVLRNDYMITDTIAAIATANGTGGVGIVRISGDNSLAIARDIFSKELNISHKMILGKVINNNSIIDEALACYFKAPNSYTGEDVVEFHCHGGINVCRMVLDAALSGGATLAEAGEFTRRAFLNGRIGLSQAEAIGDIITARTNDAVKVAANQLDGALSKKILDLRVKIVDVSAHLLATIDFSDEVDEIPYDEFKSKLYEVHEEISTLLSTADDGRMIKDGVNVAIIGAPNVGKSSFLNTVSGEDRAIVTDIEGTTRDVLEVQVNIRGCRVNLQDTAGIRQSDDVVERLGVERSIAVIEKADLILLVIDGSRELNNYDNDIINIVSDKNTVCLINKSDLPQKVTPPMFENIINISTVTGDGFDELFSVIAKRYSKGELSSKVVITNERHRQTLVKANSFILRAISAINDLQPVDIVLGDLELIVSSLGEIDGMTVSDEIIDNIFANFCVGK